MSVKEAIRLIKLVIKDSQEFHDSTQKYDLEHPDTTPTKIGHRMSKIVIDILSYEIMILECILAEIESKPRKQDSKKKNKS